ncbi:MAG TPA: tetratricopeptide repeat protein [Polyangiaceae bacterium]
MPPEEASLANDRGNTAKDARLFAEAEAEYLRALELAPDFEAPWFNLGVLYKWQTRWPEARRCVERSLELAPVDNQGALWNLGIVATALGDWETARRAWRDFGIELPPGTGPIDMELGPTPIRMKVEASEVVWCRRIDPARALVRSIPLPSSGRRYGDLLLHDGSPAGKRLLAGHEVSVFDELTLLAPSEFHTYVVQVSAPTEVAMEELLRAFGEARIPAEDWTHSVRMICKTCSEGRPHAHDHEPPEPEWKSEREVGFAARSAAPALSVLEKWRRGRGLLDRFRNRRAFGAPSCAVEGAASA